MEFDNARPGGAGSPDRGTVALVRALRGALPQACTLCRAPSGDAMLCCPCALAMPRIAAACPHCGLPSLTGAVCGRCLTAPPRYAATIAAWRYAYPADRLLHAFKYGGRLALAEPFASALAEAVLARGLPLPDRLIAIPLAARRQRERGFNHAQEIARRVASLLGIAMLQGLRRTRDTPPQAGLTMRGRARNVRGAFEATAPLAGLSIAAVDDVMTTGATFEAAAVAAHAARAARVEAWVVARTPPPGQSGSEP